MREMGDDYNNLDVFFYKQKTAYEMRISDWSSDVCSSDLTAEQQIPVAAAQLPPQQGRSHRRQQHRANFRNHGGLTQIHRVALDQDARAQGDRKSVVSGKSVSVRVDLGGRRIIQKTH